MAEGAELAELQSPGLRQDLGITGHSYTAASLVRCSDVRLEYLVFDKTRPAGARSLLGGSAFQSKEQWKQMLFRGKKTEDFHLPMPPHVPECLWNVCDIAANTRETDEGIPDVDGGDSQEEAGLIEFHIPELAIAACSWRQKSCTKLNQDETGGPPQNSWKELLKHSSCLMVS